MTQAAQDAWTQGYHAGLRGEGYDANPYDSATDPALRAKGTPWAFGCSEGWKERNRRGFAAILESLR